MPDDFITPLEVAITSSLKDIQETMAHIEESIRSTNAAVISANEASYKSINDDNKRSASELNKANKKANDEQNKSKKETADKINAEQKSTAEEVAAKMASSAIAAAGKITDQFRNLLVQYTEQQQKLSYGLFGTTMNYDTVKNALSVMGTNAYIKQNDVYNKLTNLVSSGITMNAAQRAYLETAADQVGLQFSTNTDTLNRLIQIYETDISESRLAQMSGLKEFLQAEYKNSQYIYNGFNQVSDALFQMQAWMETGAAIAAEKTIQGYLGAFASAGGSDTSRFAAALSQIGSGDFNLDPSMQNLMVMAASRAGLSYADILTGGLNASSSDALLGAMFSYIASMGNTGSNVATNAMARLFGVSMSDIRAAQGMASHGVNTDYSSDIGSFFAALENSTNDAVKLSTWWQNGLSNQALTTPLGLLGFDLVSSISNIGGQAIADSGIPLLSFFGPILQNAPAIGIISSIIGDNLKAGGLDLESFSKLSTIKTLKEKGVPGLITEVLSSMIGSVPGSASGTVLAQYNQLAGFGGGNRWNTQGSAVGIVGGDTTSFSATNDESKSWTSVTYENEEGEAEAHTFEDLYRLLAEDYPTTTFSTVANIPHETNNCVMVGSPETTQYIVDMLTITAVSTENILMLLENAFAGGTRTLIDMSALNIQNMWGDWSGTSTANP